jgi:uncharacterized protein
MGSISWTPRQFLLGLPGLTMTIEDDRMAYGERRFVTFGVLESQVVAVVHTESEDVIRIISIRKATRSEEKGYFSSLPN